MGRKKKEEKKEYLYLNVSSIFLVFLGILVIIASIQPQQTFFKELLSDIFGFSSIILGLTVIVLGLYLNPIIKFKVLTIRLNLGFLFLTISTLLIDSVRDTPSMLGKVLNNIFNPLVGNLGIWSLAIMFLFLGLFLAVNTKIKSALTVFSSITSFKLPSFLFLGKDKKIEGENEDSTDELFDLDKLKDTSEEEPSVLSEDSDSVLTSSSELSNEENKYTFVDTVSEPITLLKSQSARSASETNSVSSIGKHSSAGNTTNSSKATDEVLGSDSEGVSNGSLPFSNTIWEYPPLTLLSTPPDSKPDTGDTNQRAKIIEETLKSFGINAKVVEVHVGPSVTQYALKVGEGTKTTRILNLQGDLALALASPNGSVRIEAPIPGRSLIGVEVPNLSQEFVFLKSMLESSDYKKNNEKSKLTICLGKDVAGKHVYYALNKMPHVLIAGATGSGKSIMIHTIISTLLFANSPDECKFIMVDPKRVELVGYNNIPHLISPVITETSEAVNALKWVVGEMERRLGVLSDFGVRNIEGYNEKSGFQAMPYIVVILDELADLMMTSGNEVEKHIVRIAQLARATGIHLVLATQRPSTDIITGSIKANVPSRIAFGVASQIDSRVIIDTGGAEKLLGKGDMLFVSPESSKPKRIQGVYTNEDEIPRLVGFLKASDVQPDFEESITATAKNNTSGEASWDDESFPEAVDIVIEYGRASASLLQRRLSIGYARAARLLDELEDNGVIGPKDGSKPREVLIDSKDEIL